MDDSLKKRYEEIQDVDKRDKYLSKLLHEVFEETIYSVIKMDEDSNSDYYPYISFNRPGFISLLSRVVRLKKLDSNLNFLDVGSGLGDKVFFAYNWWNWKSTGLELNPNLYGFSKTLFKDYPIEFINVHALEFNNYSEYDIIYMFLPIKNEEMMIKLYHKIYEQMKPGAILIEAYYQEDLFGLFCERENLVPTILTTIKTIQDQNVNPAIIRKK